MVSVGDLVSPAWGDYDPSDPGNWSEVMAVFDLHGSSCLQLRRCRDGMVFGGRPDEWIRVAESAQWRGRIPECGDVVALVSYPKRWAEVVAADGRDLVLRHVAGGPEFREHAALWRVAKSAAERVAEAVMR